MITTAMLSAAWSGLPTELVGVDDLRAALERAERARPRLTITRPDDDHLIVEIGGEEVASANHDEHGWSGMEAVEQTALAVAKAAGLEVDADDSWSEVEDYAIELLHEGGRSTAEDDTDEGERFERPNDHLAACNLSINMATAIQDHPVEFLRWYRQVSA
jgi:hypothetical protein